MDISKKQPIKFRLGLTYWNNIYSGLFVYKISQSSIKFNFLYIKNGEEIIENEIIKEKKEEKMEQKILRFYFN